MDSSFTISVVAIRKYTATTDKYSDRPLNWDLFATAAR